MNFRSLIVDDEQLARENLQLMLEEHCPEISIIGMAANPKEAETFILEKKPEVVFLDIRMPAGAEGIELLGRLPKINFQVVFVTAFRDYAVKSFRANGVPFALKPLHIMDLDLVVNQIRSTTELFQKDPANIAVYEKAVQSLTRSFLLDEPSETLSVKLKDRLQLLNVADIDILEGGTETTLMLSSGSTITDPRNLRAYEEILHPSHFFRLSKLHMVNIALIKKVKLSSKGDFVVLRDKRRIPLSPLRVNPLKEILAQR